MVWCGNDHAMKRVPPDSAWVPMGIRFAQITHDMVFAIDQVATIRFVRDHEPSLILDEATRALLDHQFGGTAGLLHESFATPGQQRWAAYDATIASTDNEMIGTIDVAVQPKVA